MNHGGVFLLFGAIVLWYGVIEWLVQPSMFRKTTASISSTEVKTYVTRAPTRESLLFQYFYNVDGKTFNSGEAVMLNALGSAERRVEIEKWREVHPKGSTIEIHFHNTFPRLSSSYGNYRELARKNLWVLSALLVASVTFFILLLCMISNWMLAQAARRANEKSKK